MVDTKELASSKNDGGAGQPLYSVGMILLILLVLIAEAIATLLLLRRQAFHLNSPAVYIMPLLLLLPGLQWIRTVNKVKRCIAEDFSAEEILKLVKDSLFSAVVTAYVAIVFALILLADCAHKIALR
jgi:hypothetical protein